jgi:predicted nucleic acid-binding protein
VNVAIDSSVLVALLVPNDAWYTRATALWAAVKAGGHIGVYLGCVAAEAISAATRRLREKGRHADVQALLDRFGEQVSRESITWILPDVPALYADILAIIRTSSGELNFNDALIALACRERDIPALASFDADFDRVPWLKRLATPDDLSL